MKNEVLGMPSGNSKKFPNSKVDPIRDVLLGVLYIVFSEKGGPKDKNYQENYFKNSVLRRVSRG